MTIITEAERQEMRAIIATPLDLSLATPGAVETFARLIVIAYIDRAFYNQALGDELFYRFRTGRYES